MDGAAAAAATATAARRPLPRDSFRDVRKRQDNNKENTSHQGSNEIMVQKDRQTEWTKPGRVFNRNINRGGQSRSSFPGVTQEFRVVKDNRTKLKAHGETLPGSFHNGDSSNEQAVSNVGDKRTNEMVSSKIAHSLPQPQHQDNSAPQNFKAYEPDYEMAFITKSVDGGTVQTRSYPSEVSVSSASEQPVPHMYQQVQVPQYANFLPYRHVFSPYYAPPVAVPSYSSNPAFPQLPHASSYLLMQNAAPHEIGSMKYGPPHQYKQMFPGSPAGYGSYPNQNGYSVSNGIVGSTGTVEDVSMSKYKDSNIYGPNQQAETADVWIQAHREISNMPPTPFYNMMGQPMSPHTGYLPAHNGHAPFSPAPHPAHLHYPGMPHPLQPTSMTMLQNPQSMVHHQGGNIGIDMTAMAPGAQAGAFPGAQAGAFPGAQAGAFQQNQLGHVGWAPSNY